MADKYITQEVPFQRSGNYSYLSDEQLATHPWIAEFVDRWKHCFEYDAFRCIWLYMPRA